MDIFDDQHQFLNMNSDYSKQLLSTFRLHRDPKNAEYMGRYMKDKFPYYGIKSPLRKEISKPFLARPALPPISEVPSVINLLWSHPEREMQYFSLDLLSKYARVAPKDWIDLYEELILTKSWWDSVDGLASNQVGGHFQKFPDLIAPYTDKWMASGNIWLQRTCLLFQLKYRGSTDFVLLTTFIKPLASSKEFFIKKAIGWSLRQFGKFSPDKVKNFVAEQPMSNLSRKEALRLIA